MVSFRDLIQNFRQTSPPLSYGSPHPECNFPLSYLSQKVVHSFNDLFAWNCFTGWGDKKQRQPGRAKSLKRLRKAEVPVVDQSTCVKANKKYVITDNMFCAGYFNGTLGDACQGDSGGPLAIDNSLSLDAADERWVLAGVISWGRRCGGIGSYGVYTRVSKFARWINNQINKDD